MYAAQGDRLIVQSAHTDRARREGEILEVHGPNGSPPYLVLWSDTGHESLVFPGPDAFVEHWCGRARSTILRATTLQLLEGRRR